MILEALEGLFEINLWFGLTPPTSWRGSDVERLRERLNSDSQALDEVKVLP